MIGYIIILLLMIIVGLDIYFHKKRMAHIKGMNINILEISFMFEEIKKSYEELIK